MVILDKNIKVYLGVIIFLLLFIFTFFGERLLEAEKKIGIIETKIEGAEIYDNTIQWGH